VLDDEGSIILTHATLDDIADGAAADHPSPEALRDEIPGELGHLPATREA
jgi:hypothetical protein